MSKPLWFDITMYAPDRKKSGGISKRSMNQYQHINFMIHLLWGVPYHSNDEEKATVHGSVYLLAQAMKNNVTDRDWPTVFVPVVTIMKPLLTKLMDDAKKAGYPAVADLYFGVENHETYKYGKIIERCRTLRDELRVAGYDICLPFIDAYDDGNSPDSRIFVNYSKHLENTTLMDLYISPVLSSRQKGAIVKFMKGGVFRPRAQKSGLAIAGPGADTNEEGNGYECNGSGTGCKRSSNPECYCSTDSAGNCSAMTTCP